MFKTEYSSVLVGDTPINESFIQWKCQRPAQHLEVTLCEGIQDLKNGFHFFKKIILFNLPALSLE